MLERVAVPVPVAKDAADPELAAGARIRLVMKLPWARRCVA
jgi:hypothetical protein